MTGEAGAAGPPFRADRVYLGWRQAAVHPDPGPPPRRPSGTPPERLDPGWFAAQRREHARISLPYRVAGAASAAAGAAAFGLGRGGLLSGPLAAAMCASCASAVAWSGREVWRGRRALGALVAAEQRRLGAVRAARESQLAREQAEHARRFRDWQSRREAFERQPLWLPVHLPDAVHRIDVLGGTAAGWAALLTTIGAARLAAGGQITVIDLSRGGVGRDLVALAERTAAEPLVWALPGDLPRLDLGIGMPRRLLADTLAASAAADADARGPDGGESGSRARDQAVLERVLEVLGEGASLAAALAGLRALGQIGDPRADIGAGLLTGGQLEAITAMFGRAAADRVVVERAWALEARLRPLEPLGAGLVPLPRGRLRVIAVDRAAGAPAEAVLGSYVTVALSHLLRELPAGEPWRQTLCVVGAERLADDVLDRLCDACELSGAGLVLAFRSASPRVRARLGRGNAAVAFMRLGNAEDAKAASEQIGAEHRFVVSQLTDTVGESVTGTFSGSYTTTVGSSESLSASLSSSRTSGRSRGRGYSRSGGAPLAPGAGTGHREASGSRGSSESLSFTEGITASTSWGASTARAVAASSSLARGAQRSREFLVEPHELQQLPPSAVIVSYAGPGGRQVVLADANPGIAALPAAALLSPEEAERAAARPAEPVGWRSGPGQPPPNLGPPAPPPDWRVRP